MIGAMVMGEVSAFSPDYVKAKIAAARLFKIFDRVSAIDSSSEEGLEPVSSAVLSIFIIRNLCKSKPEAYGEDFTDKTRH